MNWRACFRQWLPLVLLLLVALAACELTRDQNQQETSAQPVSLTSDMGAAYQKLVKIRRDKPLEVDQFIEHYDKNFLFYVKGVDQRFNTALEVELRDTLGKVANHQNLAGNAQTAEKLVQYAFFVTLVHSLSAIEEQKNTEEALKMAKQAAPIIGYTVDRRGKWVGAGEEYLSNFQLIVTAIGDAVQNQQAEPLKKAVAQMRSLLTKVYVLSVFYELGGLAEARGQEDQEDLLAEKLAESRVYFRFIKDELNKRNAQGAAAMAAELAKKAADIDVGLLRELLKKSFADELAGINAQLLGD